MKQEGHLRLGSQLRLHPSMVQGLGLLSLSNLELRQFLQERLVSNPFLEEAPWEEELFGETLKASQAAELPWDPPASKTLLEHLWPQVLELGLSPREKRAALLLLGNLDEKGYLDGDLELVAREAALDGELLASLQQRLQNLDPPGLVCGSLVESLRVQLEQFHPQESLARRLLWEHSERLFSGGTCSRRWYTSAYQ